MEQEVVKHKIVKYSKFEKRDFFFAYALVAFPILQFLVFWVYVNASSIFLAFQTETGEFTLLNFKAVFSSFTKLDTFGLDFGKSLQNSMTLWVINHVVCFPVTVVTTYILQRKIWGHYLWRVCYIIPSLMGSVVWTSLVKYMVSYDGLIVNALVSIGMELPEMVLRNGLFAAEETAFPTLITITTIMGFVGNNAVLTGAYSRVPDEIFESAKLDGAGFWREFISIAVPCVWPTLATLMTFGLCGIFTADANVFLYSNGTGKPGMSTVGFHLYYITYQISMRGATNSAFGYPAAIGFTLTMMTLPIVLIGRWALEKMQDAVEL